MSQPSPDLLRAFARQRQTPPRTLESALVARNVVSPADLRRLLPGLTGGGDLYSTMPALSS